MRKLLLGTTAALILATTYNANAGFTAATASHVSTENVYYGTATDSAKRAFLAGNSGVNVIAKLASQTTTGTYTMPTLAGVTLTEKTWYAPDSAWHLRVPIKSSPGTTFPADAGDWQVVVVKGVSLISKYKPTSGTEVTLGTAVSSIAQFYNTVGTLKQWVEFVGSKATPSYELTTSKVDLGTQGKIFRITVGDPDSDSSIQVSLYCTYAYS